MPIQAACPACGVPLQLPDDSPGRGFQCVRCGAGLVTGAGGQLFTQPQPVPAANPFSDAPQGGYYAPGPYAPGYFPPPLMSREAALAKVKGPAVLLQVLGVLLIFAGLATPLVFLVPEADRDDFLFFFTLIAGPASLAMGGFTVFCGSRMQALQSYGLVMASVIVILLVGVVGCWPAVLPFIWPLVVLLDSGVKANFGARPAISDR